MVIHHCLPFADERRSVKSGLSGRRFLSFPAPPLHSYFFVPFCPMPSHVFRACPAWLKGNGNDSYSGYTNNNLVIHCYSHLSSPSFQHGRIFYDLTDSVLTRFLILQTRATITALLFIPLPKIIVPSPAGSKAGFFHRTLYLLRPFLLISRSGQIKDAFFCINFGHSYSVS